MMDRGVTKQVPCQEKVKSEFKSIYTYTSIRTSVELAGDCD